MNPGSTARAVAADVLKVFAEGHGFKKRTLQCCKLDGVIVLGKFITLNVHLFVSDKLLD